MFASPLEDTFTLHYGTDPLLGFHLATAYASLNQDSPLKASVDPGLSKVVTTARLQFRKWSASFRKYAQNTLTIRFFNGDALAFCHTLQYYRTSGNESLPNWYRDQYQLEPLSLDEEEYVDKGNAPSSFHVIETSNLVDHLGGINLLTAVSSLLDHSPSAVLYAEILVKSEEDTKSSIDSLLCGHFPTICILFGLAPVEYWTNSSIISNTEELMMDAALSSMSDKQDKMNQSHKRLTLRRLATNEPADCMIRFNGSELAQVLHGVHLEMFQGEDLSRLCSNLSIRTHYKNVLPHYHRRSFASFLLCVQQRVVVDWDDTMNVLVRLIENESTLQLGLNCIQELYLQMHVLGLYSTIQLKSSAHGRSSRVATSLGKWRVIPESVCITLRIPRAKLRVITEVPPIQLGSPLLQCTLQSSSKYRGKPWHKIFAMIQLVFGEVSTIGSRHDDNFKLHVVEDVRCWNRQSPLIASFVVPTWLVLQEPVDAIVALTIQSTLHSSPLFATRLGYDMSIYKTTLGNESDVFIAKHRPNLPGDDSVYKRKISSTITNKLTNRETASTIDASIDVSTRQIIALSRRVDIISEDAKIVLRDGAIIKSMQTSPCIIEAALGDSGPKCYFHFPVPILQSRNKLRVARKSSYVEIVVPLADPRYGNRFPYFMYPISPELSGPCALEYATTEPRLSSCSEYTEQERLGMAQYSYHIHVLVSRTSHQRREQKEQEMVEY